MTAGTAVSLPLPHDERQVDRPAPAHRDHLIGADVVRTVVRPRIAVKIAPHARLRPRVDGRRAGLQVVVPPIWVDEHRRAARDFVCAHDDGPGVDLDVVAVAEEEGVVGRDGHRALRVDARRVGDDDVVHKRDDRTRIPDGERLAVAALRVLGDGVVDPGASGLIGYEGRAAGATAVPRNDVVCQYVGIPGGQTNSTAYVGRVADECVGIEYDGVVLTRIHVHRPALTRHVPRESVTRTTKPPCWM